MVTAGDQKALEAGQLKPNHKSAYDYEGFTKATARVDSPSHDLSGDHSVDHRAKAKEMAHGD